MEPRRLITIALWVIAAFFWYLTLAEGFNLPNQGKYKGQIDRYRQLEEKEMESSREQKPQRKASENKRPWLSDSLNQMENMVFGPFGNAYNPPNMPWKDYPWPDGTRQSYPYGEVPLDSGCVIDSPPYWDIVDKGTTFIAKFNIIIGVVKKIKVVGPAKPGKLSGLEIPVHVYPNAKDGSIVKVQVWTVSVTTSGKKAYGFCQTETKIDNSAECQCVGASPTIYASSSTIAAGGTVTMYVDSGGIACPPYTWSVDGAGYTIAPSTTENDLEITTLSLDAGGGDCSSGVTVIDSCGVSYNATILNASGSYVYMANCAPTYSGGSWCAYNADCCHVNQFPVLYRGLYKFILSGSSGRCWYTLPSWSWPGCGFDINLVTPYEGDPFSMWAGYCTNTCGCFGNPGTCPLASITAYIWICP